MFMLNQVSLVGRINCKPYDNFLSIKMKDYDKEFNIMVYISDSIRDNILQFINTGDLVGIRGKIDINNGNIIINAEKITFLSSNN